MKEESKAALPSNVDRSEKGYIIRPYDRGDEIGINEMFNEVFHQNRSLDDWYWKYRDNPVGSPIISLAYSPDNILAAHFAAYPLKLWFHPSGDHTPIENTIYHAGDKMTRRRFRTVGFAKNALLTRTYLHFVGTATMPDTLFKYGFMAHHSLRFGLRFLNYTMIEPVAYRTLALKALPPIRSSLIAKLLTGLKIEVVSDIDETWTDFFYRNAKHYKLLVKRDAPYLKWRYLLRPGRKYLIVAARKRTRLIGWSIFYREGRKVVWGDSFFERGELECIKPMLSFVGTLPFSQGADVIEGWFPPRPAWWDSALRLLSFQESAEPNGLHFCVGNYAEKNVSELVKACFYYTLGDSDLF